MSELSGARQDLVLHWGEMGTRWGINRTVAQIHCLLYLAPRPLHAEAITNTLGVARSNVSTSLKELQGWGLVKVVHVLGDRRDHFETLDDPWELFRVVVEERKRREFDPTLQVLRDTTAAMAKERGESSAYAAKQAGALLEFFETTLALHKVLSGLSPAAVRRLTKAGGKLGKFLGGGR